MAWVVGTDSGDQRLQVYRSEIKTKSWISRVLIHFLNLAIVNAYSWYTKAFPGTDLSHYKFREKLVDELVALEMNEQSKETGEIFERSINKK